MQQRIKSKKINMWVILSIPSHICHHHNSSSHSSSSSNSRSSSNTLWGGSKQDIIENKQ